MAPLNILIVGCGIAGPVLATFLLLSQVPTSQKPLITILERSAVIRPQGQNVDIRGVGLTIIRKLGIEAEIRASTTGEEGVQFVDSENRVLAAFAADRTGEISTPTADIEILRGRLAEICWKRSKLVSDQAQKDGGAGIQYIFGDYLDDVDQDGHQVHVRFAKSGQRRSFDLVVGADGLQSLTRKMVWGVDGEEDRVRRLGMSGAFFSIPKEETDSAWRRWFHAPGRGIMLRPSDQKDRTTVFMTITNDKDPRLINVTARNGGGVDAQKKLMQEFFHGVGWESERIVQEMMVSKDFYFDMVAQIKMECWSKGRVVLLADAGYCASPISGMGTTLALSGAYHLAGCLTQHVNGHALAFAEYERSMRPMVQRAQRLILGAPYILNPRTKWGVWTLNTFVSLMYWSGLFNLLFRTMGPPANLATLEEYGFQNLPECVDPVEKESLPEG